MQAMQNKLMVIEGLDGSGKSTQVKMLREYLENKNIEYKYLHFPQLERTIHGELVARFLRGEFGSLNQVDPYLVALLYAGDRNECKEEMAQWLKEGYFILLDRYVFSNISYQCAKLDDWEKRAKLREWILNLEFNQNQLLKPAISVFLDVPFNFTASNLSKTRTGDDRDYLNGQVDIHEADLKFQEQVREVYLWQVKQEQDFMKIDCFNEHNEMLEPDVVHQKLINALKV